jgi:predicted nucleotidyltransferase
MLTEEHKKVLKQELVNCLKTEAEVCRVVIFGSFLNSDYPHDLDVAVFQDSDEKYLPLAMKYRKKTRDIARRIALDIIPLKVGRNSGVFLDEIKQGEIIYERRDQEMA